MRILKTIMDLYLVHFYIDVGTRLCKNIFEKIVSSTTLNPRHCNSFIKLSGPVIFYKNVPLLERCNVIVGGFGAHMNSNKKKMNGCINSSKNKAVVMGVGVVVDNVS